MQDARRFGWSRGFFDHLRERAVDAAPAASPSPTFVRPDGRGEVVRRARGLLDGHGSARVTAATGALRSCLPEDPSTLTALGLIQIAGAAKDLATAYRMEGGRRPDEDAADAVYNRAMDESRFH